MADIVQRLRWHADDKWSAAASPALCDEAADEIDGLRRLLVEARQYMTGSEARDLIGRVDAALRATDQQADGA